MTTTQTTALVPANPDVDADEVNDEFAKHTTGAIRYLAAKIDDATKKNQPQTAAMNKAIKEFFTRYLKVMFSEVRGEIAEARGDIDELRDIVDPTNELDFAKKVLTFCLGVDAFVKKIILAGKLADEKGNIPEDSPIFEPFVTFAAVLKEVAEEAEAIVDELTDPDGDPDADPDEPDDDDDPSGEGAPEDPPDEAPEVKPAAVAANG